MAPRPTSLRPTRRDGVLLALILVVGAALRLVVIVHAPVFMPLSDSTQFLLTSQTLLETGEFAAPLKRPPLYSIFLAGVTATLGRQLESIAVVQHLLGLGSIVLAYVVGTLVFGRPAGLLAAAFMAIKGPLLLMEQSLYAEALLTPLLLACLAALLLALRGGRLALFLLCGLVLGLAALTRPAAQAILPLILAAAFGQRRPWRPRLLAAGLVCAGFLLVVGPWMLRNQALHGGSTISSGLGDSLFSRIRRYDHDFTLRDLANQPDDTVPGQVRQRIFKLARDGKYPRPIRTAIQDEFQLTELQGDAAMRDVAMLIIRQEPERYLRGTATMFLDLGLGRATDFEEGHFWEGDAEPKYLQDWPEAVRASWVPSEHWTATGQTITTAVINLYGDHRLSGLIGLLFLLGALRCVVDWRSGAVVLPLVVVTQLLLHVALNGPLVRYRYPLEPLITIVAAGGCTLVVAATRALIWRNGPRAAVATRAPETGDSCQQAGARLARPGVRGEQRIS